MIKTATKHGVRLEATHPLSEVKQQLPAIRNIQTKTDVKPETLCDKYGKCIRNIHRIKTLKDATDLATNIPNQHNVIVTVAYATIARLFSFISLSPTLHFTLVDLIFLLYLIYFT